MMAVFQIDGNTPLDSDRLNTCRSGTMRLSMYFLTKTAGMPSGPRFVDDFNCEAALNITASSMSRELRVLPTSKGTLDVAWLTCSSEIISSQKVLAKLTDFLWL